MPDYDSEETRRLDEAMSAMKTCGDSAREGLSVVYDVMAARMMRAAFAVTANRSDAEDAVQDSFMKLYAHADLYTGVGRPQAIS